MHVVCAVSFWYCPWVHGSQVGEPSGVITPLVPVPHASQAVWPCTNWWLPMVHATGVVVPAFGHLDLSKWVRPDYIRAAHPSIYPIGQRSQLIVPTPSAYLPGSHGSHCAEPDTLAKCPTPQRVHVGLPAPATAPLSPRYAHKQVGLATLPRPATDNGPNGEG
jgi:hypothetical protein